MGRRKDMTNNSFFVSRKEFDLNTFLTNLRTHGDLSPMLRFF